MKLNNLINKFYHNNFFSRIFHTSVYCLQKELKNCKSVLDLGCGPSSPLQYCQNIKYSIGIEAYKPYLAESKNKKIHTKYFNKKIEELNFPDKSFDAVIMIEVLEHLPKKLGYEILRKAEKWAIKKIIITTPNGYLHQKQLDKNMLQKHISSWTKKDFKWQNYKIFGLAGLKYLRKESENESMNGDLLSPIKYSPRFFWFIVLTISQIFVYYFPGRSFELFCVKRV